MNKLLAFAALCFLLAACNSMGPGTGTYSASFGPGSSSFNSTDADYRFIGQMGGP